MSLKNSRRICIWIAVLALALGCEPTPAREVTRTIGSEGGTLELDGVSLVVPPGALASSVELKLAIVEPSEFAALPAGSESASDLISLTPHGQTFDAPVTVTIPVSDSAASHVVSLDNADDTSWEVLVGAQVSATSAIFEIDHFSGWGVITQPNLSVDGGSDAGCEEPPTECDIANNGLPCGNCGIGCGVSTSSGGEYTCECDVTWHCCTGPNCSTGLDAGSSSSDSGCQEPPTECDIANNGLACGNCDIGCAVGGNSEEPGYTCSCDQGVWVCS